MSHSQLQKSHYKITSVSVFVVHVLVYSLWWSVGNERDVLKGKYMKYEPIGDVLAAGKLLSHYLECDWSDIYL